MLSNYQQSLQSQLDEIKRSVIRPNVLLLGKTGAGKSKLANLVFGGHIFEEGTGKPVTKGISFYASTEKGVGIFDSKGYEFGTKGEEAFFDEVVKFATKPSQFCIGQAVHLCWYCIPAEQERIPAIDTRTIAEIRSLGIPTAVLLTKSDLLSMHALAVLAKKLERDLPPNTPIFKTSTIRLTDGTDMEALCSWSKKSLPDALQIAFIRAQKVQLQTKKEAALRIVNNATQQAATMSLSPHDPVVTDELIQRCIRMTAEILYVYEMEEMERSLGGMTGLIEGSHKLVSLMAYLLEGFSEFLGHILGDETGRVFGKLIGRILSSVTHSQASQKVVGAVGSSVIEICSSLAESAVAGANVANTSADTIRGQFEDKIRKRLED